MSATQSIISITALGARRSRAVSLLHKVTRDSALPMHSACHSNQWQKFHFMVFLSAVLIPLVGCSTSRQSIASSGSPSAIATHSAGVAAAETSAPVPETDFVSPIKTVAQQVSPLETDAIAVIGEYSDEAVTFAPQLDSEAPRVPGEVEPVGGLTLEAIEQLALANNPAIQQVAAAAARTRGIRNQVGRKPNPSVGYLGAQLADAGTDQHSLFIEQTFVRGDKLAWNQQVIGHDVNAMNWLVEAQRQRLRTDIRLVFYEALAAQKRIELSNEFRLVAKKGVTVSEEQLKGAVGTRPDVLQSEIQLNEVDLAIQQAQFEYSAAWNEMAALTGLPDLGQSTLVGDLNAADATRDSDAEFARIVAESPLLAAAQARVDRARSNLQRQRAQAISNVTAQLGGGHDNGTGQGFVNVQLSVPVPVHNKNLGNIQAARAEYCEATQNVERIRMSIRRDLARVMREYQVANATVRRYEEAILPKAREALELMQQARDAGEFDFLRVLTARRAYFDANLKYVVASGQLAQTNAKIEGLLMSGGLSNVASYDGDDGLRGQALSQQ